jgi:flagellar biosynthesis protein FliP
MIRLSRTMTVRRLALTAMIAVPVALAATTSFAQSIDLTQLLPEGSGSASGRMIQFVALLTVLSLAPGLLIMVTSFTRFIIALSFLRSGLGLQTTPANIVMISLALFMTFYVMGPTFDRAWQDGVAPLQAGSITEEEAYGRITGPFRDFMLANVRPRDMELFADLGGIAPDAPAATEMRTLVPAFMISELRRGFEIGFLILLPFLVIDLIVSTLTMSMGMMMMPPTVIALPFKILFFILIDGWNLLIGSLVRSFA